MLKEFKEFAMRGNVLDMAIGIIIGAGDAWQFNLSSHMAIASSTSAGMHKPPTEHQ